LVFVELLFGCAWLLSKPSAVPSHDALGFVLLTTPGLPAAFTSELFGA
jgi:hypothetical protein